MANPLYNDQTANKRDADKSPERKTTSLPTARPNFEQVKQTLPTQKAIAGNFQVVPEFVDKLD